MPTSSVHLGVLLTNMSPDFRSLTFQWGCGNYSGFGDGGAYDADGIGDNASLEFNHPCESAHHNTPIPPYGTVPVHFSIFRVISCTDLMRRR